MATIVVKTIGTGGDYSTLQAWEDACPANLVAADQIWQGQVKNQVFSSTSNLLTISGTTVDATRYVELTTAPGASFVDNAAVRTNALRYNEANGAAIKITATYSNAVLVNQSFTHISKLQFLSTGTSNGYLAALAMGTTSGNSHDIDQCIFEASTPNSAIGGTALSLSGWSNSKIKRSLIVQKSTNAAARALWLNGYTSIYNCTLVSLNATLTDAVYSHYGTAIMENSYVGNAANVFTGGTAWTVTASKCSTAVADFTIAPFSTTTFTSVADGSHDFRTITGSALIDGGVADPVNAPADITGLAWSGGTDVGAWGFVGAGGTNGTGVGSADSIDLIAPTGTGTGTTSGGGTNGSGSGPVAAVSLTSTAGTGSGTVAGSGTITTPALRNNTGTLLASISGWTLNIYNVTTGVRVLQVTGLSTSAAGILSVTSASLAPGTTYSFEPVHATYGRRLPVGVAT